MKKVRTGILAAALLLTIGVTGAFAAGPGWGRHADWNSSCPAADASCRYDADGDGLCDNCGAGANYVDADGDGVCDHWGRQPLRSRPRHGQRIQKITQQ